MEGKKNKEKSEEVDNMAKRNIFFKPRMISKTDEETLYNTFPLYVITVMETFFLALLQDEFNLHSFILICLGVIIACTAAYKIGQNSGK